MWRGSAPVCRFSTGLAVPPALPLSMYGEQRSMPATIGRHTRGRDAWLRKRKRGPTKQGSMRHPWPFARVTTDLCSGETGLEQEKNTTRFKLGRCDTSF
ncbi:uncharacterized protein B0H64DRAFT_395733 [Chaetomium fimeti]|uniref:Uncharacterized protein n=1 Tax=Chaetomium fimeti TaxID=1854472 RepID=A0AAE0HFG8_9PEZI|nr:hypothetical protein B0H64DRAFT_395733 [Chaetomium fimeti]